MCELCKAASAEEQELARKYNEKMGNSPIKYPHNPTEEELRTFMLAKGEEAVNLYFEMTGIDPLGGLPTEHHAQATMTQPANNHGWVLLSLYPLFWILFLIILIIILCKKMLKKDSKKVKSLSGKLKRNVKKKEIAAEHKCALSSCGNPGAHRCKRCKSVYYCSKECSEENWTRHRPSCKKREK